MQDSGGGRTVSSYEPGRCNKDACDQGIYPGKGAKHNLGQGQRDQAEARELPRGSEDLRGLVEDGI
jgi:hypothetical protein